MVCLKNILEADMPLLAQLCFFHCDVYPCCRGLHDYPSYFSRVNAGLDAPGEFLGGWEDGQTEIRGQFMGHWLSSTAMLAKNTGTCLLVKEARAAASFSHICFADQ